MLHRLHIHIGASPFSSALFAALTRAIVDATGYAVSGGALMVSLADGSTTGLANAAHFAGYSGDAGSPSAILLRNNGLHIEIAVDRNHPVGRDDPAGVKDIVLEAAMTTIMDLEDSVSTVDAEDKVVAYRNWLGLIKGCLLYTSDAADE